MLAETVRSFRRRGSIWQPSLVSFVSHTYRDGNQWRRKMNATVLADNTNILETNTMEIEDTETSKHESFLNGT